MGFISPEARQSGKHYDSDSAFQCGNYRNQNNECVSHFIKTSALEAAILQAIKAVSQYVIENEAEFISQLKTVWNESKSKSANNGQQEIDEAKKRMAELDAKIQKLYDSAISGLLPERQAQRMIQQYDEEQLMLEKRVEELQGQMLSVKLSDEKCDKWYRRFYYNLRLQMQEYYQHKAVIMDSYWNHHMEKSYGEADEV